MHVPLGSAVLTVAQYTYGVPVSSGVAGCCIILAVVSISEAMGFEEKECSVKMSLGDQGETCSRCSPDPGYICRNIR